MTIFLASSSPSYSLVLSVCQSQFNQMKAFSEKPQKTLGFPQYSLCSTFLHHLTLGNPPGVLQSSLSLTSIKCIIFSLHFFSQLFSLSSFLVYCHYSQLHKCRNPPNFILSHRLLLCWILHIRELKFCHDFNYPIWADVSQICLLGLNSGSWWWYIFQIA